MPLRHSYNVTALPAKAGTHGGWEQRPTAMDTDARQESGARLYLWFILIFFLALPACKSAESISPPNFGLAYHCHSVDDFSEWGASKSGPYSDKCLASYHSALTYLQSDYDQRTASALVEAFTNDRYHPMTGFKVYRCLVRGTLSKYAKTDNRHAQNLLSTYDKKLSALIARDDGKGFYDGRPNDGIYLGHSACLALPIAHSNNAVAIAVSPDGPTLYSFNGLRAGKAYTDVSKQAFACLLETACRQLADVPVPEGRLASSAITLNNTIYLFGGYSVAADGTEVSTPEVLAFDPKTETYTQLPDMPVPVDDAVIFTHQDRYIYLVSGWHDDGNVADVQVYDTQKQTWARATDYPGAPVFGHSGGAVNGNIVIVDGVAVIGHANGRRQFGAVDQVWIGSISPTDPLSIIWVSASAHPGSPVYRAASTGRPSANQVVFAGGGDNPYNIDGIGYDGVPAKPSGRIFAYDFDQNAWLNLGHLPTPSMDHRGLLLNGSTAYIIGGLDADLNVRDAITEFELED